MDWAGLTGQLVTGQPVTGQPVIIGAGIAGLAAALFLSPRPVIVVNKGRFASGATNWAQGGIAAAVGDDDEPALHAADTIAVGGGLVDEAVARMVATAAPGAIRILLDWGVPFDLDPGGHPVRGLEAGHSRRRIVHAGGDATGHEIIVALTERARQTRSITLLEEVKATTILTEGNRVTGVAIASRNGDSGVIATSCVVLATGGIGQLYAHTTNPPGAGGSGLLLAARAGAVFKDMEFVQFHPTAMDIGKDPMPLATEALRGQGAKLVTNSGDAVMAGAPQGDLSPRDVVARGLWRAMEGGARTFLDCRPVADFAVRFPTVHASCLAAGIDATVTPIPVRPAAHYHMGGVEVDQKGRTSVEGLWAGGEVSCTGLHGANRLASNSLLEAVVYGQQIANDIAGATLPMPRRVAPPAKPGPVEGQDYRKILESHAGVMRDRAGLEQAAAQLAKGFLAKHGPSALGFIIALAALDRRESRGAHFRTDFPETGSEAAHSRMTLAQAAVRARQMAD